MGLLDGAGERAERGSRSDVCVGRGACEGGLEAKLRGTVRLEGAGGQVQLHLLSRSEEEESGCGVEK